MSILAWPLGYFGGVCHACGCCVHLAAIIVTGVYRYSANGELCVEYAKSLEVDGGLEIVYNEDGDTFSLKKHADAISALFISQAVLFCFYNCIVGLTTSMGRVMADMKRHKITDL